MGNINVERFREMYETSEDYKEVRENPKMNNIHILCLSGSHAYGTAREDSDVDFRAVVGLDKARALGAMSDWGTTDFKSTDTSIYSYKKFLQLMTKGNPSTICLLGNNIDDYIYLSPEGKELVTNYHGLIPANSVYDSFVGYSNGMLKRLELSELGRLDEYGDTIENVILDNKKIEILNNNVKLFHNRYKSLKHEDDICAKFEIDENVVYVKNFSIKDISMIDFFDMVKDLKNISSSFGTKGKRNRKKSDFKLNKHCMHLVRGLLMGNELLETGKIVTYRKNDLELLHDILNGKLMGSNGKMRGEFYEMVDELKVKADYALKNTVLPQEVDEKKLEYFYEIFLKSAIKRRKE